MLAEWAWLGVVLWSEKTRCFAQVRATPELIEVGAVTLSFEPIFGMVPRAGCHTRILIRIGIVDVFVGRRLSGPVTNLVVDRLGLTFSHCLIPSEQGVPPRGKP